MCVLARRVCECAFAYVFDFSVLPFLLSDSGEAGDITVVSEIHNSKTMIGLGKKKVWKRAQLKIYNIFISLIYNIKVYISWGESMKRGLLSLTH